MSLNVLFSARRGMWDDYRAPLAAAFTAAGLSVDLRADLDPDLVDYIVYAPDGPVSDFSCFSRLRAVLGLWAGVEHVVGNATLTVPMTRLVDSGLTEGMVEWVTGHVLRYHLGMDAQICTQNGVWAPEVPPLARDRRVGILGLGALGSACAQALAALNFSVSGWSRSSKSIAGIICLSGDAGLPELLKSTDILVLLLPLTATTENLLNAERLALLPRGAFLLNPGRGALIDDRALLRALDAGQIAHATLDVFRTEPLPADHPYWSHPNVTVTPHIASETRVNSAALVIAENIRRNEAGEPMQFVVDRAAGY